MHIISIEINIKKIPSQRAKRRRREYCAHKYCKRRARSSASQWAQIKRQIHKRLIIIPSRQIGKTTPTADAEMREASGKMEI